MASNGLENMLEPIDSDMPRLRLLTKLGEGGFAIVYKAQNTDTGEVNAVKLLKIPGYMKGNDLESYIERFKREIKISRLIKSPHFVNVSAGGRVGWKGKELWAYVMEHLDLLTGPEDPENPGEQLKHPENLRHPYRSDKEILNFLARAAKGLHDIHETRLEADDKTQINISQNELGIVHRDIKPANIFVTQDGRVKIGDMGIAKVNANTQLTMTGTVIGTPQYMSPEQINALEIDRRSDIYSLGATGYEWFSGNAPFEEHASNPMKIAGLLMNGGKPKSLREIRPNLDARALSVIEKMMEIDPANRQTNMLEVATDFASILKGKKPISVRVGPTSVMPKEALPDYTPSYEAGKALSEGSAEDLAEMQPSMAITPVRATGRRVPISVPFYKKPLFAALASGALLLGGAGAYAAFHKSGNNIPTQNQGNPNPTPVPTPIPTPTPIPVPTPVPTPTPTPVPVPTPTPIPTPDPRETPKGLEGKLGKVNEFNLENMNDIYKTDSVILVWSPRQSDAEAWNTYCESLAKKYPNVYFARIEYDKNNGTLDEMIAQKKLSKGFGRLPTTIFMKNGMEYHRIEGRGKEGIQMKLTKEYGNGKPEPKQDVF